MKNSNKRIIENLFNTACNDIAKGEHMEPTLFAVGRFVDYILPVTLKDAYILLALFIFSMSISCSSIYDVSYDYNKDADLIRLKTFDWLPVPQDLDINSLDIIRIKKAVTTELEAKGIVRAKDNPDFLIAEHVKTKDKIDVSAWGYGLYPGYGRHSRYSGFWGNGGVHVYQYEEGTLILDFVDPKTKDVIWHGAAKSVVDDTMAPEKRENLINEAVQKILMNFPPPSSF